MTDIQIIDLLRNALMTVIVVSAPMMAAGMLVGLIVAIFQTTTSIQEQTLTFVPKIVAIFLTLIATSAWMIHSLESYTINLFTMIGK